MYICPKCGRNLISTGKQMKCDENHSYDISAEGYVNLLLGSKKSGIHGDSKDMLRSRRRFLQQNYYFPIVENLVSVIERTTAKDSVITLLDAGCGEGYYSGSLAKILSEKGYRFQIYGIDVSKEGVKAAAKRYRELSFSVASINKLPFANDVFDVIISLFAPLSEKEFFRTLKKGGILLTVSPGARHLWSLKEKIYDKPAENPPPSFKPVLLKETENFTVGYRFRLSDNQTVRDLFDMTPYRYNTSETDYNKLGFINSIDTEAIFDFCAFTKL